MEVTAEHGGSSEPGKVRAPEAGVPERGVGPVRSRAHCMGPQGGHRGRSGSSQTRPLYHQETHSAVATTAPRQERRATVGGTNRQNEDVEELSASASKLKSVGNQPRLPPHVHTKVTVTTSSGSPRKSTHFQKSVPWSKTGN